MADQTAEIDAVATWRQVEARCAHLAQSTPVSAVLAIVRDVLLPPGPEQCGEG